MASLLPRPLAAARSHTGGTSLPGRRSRSGHVTLTPILTSGHLVGPVPTDPFPPALQQPDHPNVRAV